MNSPYSPKAINPLSFVCREGFDESSKKFFEPYFLLIVFIDMKKVKRIPIRENRIKSRQPRKKTLVQRIIQWRLIGYIVILIGLLQLDTPIDYLILQMFLLILFTELQSRGISKKKIDNLKEELQVVQEIHYEDRDTIEREGLLAQEKKDSLKVKQDIEKNYKPRL